MAEGWSDGDHTIMSKRWSDCVHTVKAEGLRDGDVEGMVITLSCLNGGSDRVEALVSDWTEKIVITQKLWTGLRDSSNLINLPIIEGGVIKR